VNERLQRLFLHAFEQVPYYRDKWIGAGLTRRKLAQLTVDELPELPVVPKRDLRLSPDAFVAESIARRHRLHRYHSSGSTGTPVTHICTAVDHRRFIAGREARSFGWAGTSVREARSMIGGRMIVPKGVARPPYYRYNWAERQVYFTAYHISPDTVGNYVEGFNRYRPSVLTGYAYSHYSLARMMREQGLTLDYAPKALVLSSEKLTAAMKAVMKEAFRARAYEEYGAVENCMLGTECELGRLHAHPDFGIIEIVDEAGEPVPAGVDGRVLCTGLLNETQPLIRYEIGDVGRWSSEKCPCGRDHLPVIEELVGRVEDTVVGPDGRELVRFHGIFIDLPHVMEGQVIQQAIDRFLVKVVAKPGFSLEEEEVIRERFAERLGPVSVEIERVIEIPRTERGKFRAVICRIPLKDRRRPFQLVGS
jgi:phenylacetate-CoA ligase